MKQLRSSSIAAGNLDRVEQSPLSIEDQIYTLDEPSKLKGFGGSIGSAPA